MLKWFLFQRVDGKWDQEPPGLCKSWHSASSSGYWFVEHYGLCVLIRGKEGLRGTGDGDRNLDVTDRMEWPHFPRGGLSWIWTPPRIIDPFYPHLHLKFSCVLGYIASLRSVWNTWDPVSKQTNMIPSPKQDMKQNKMYHRNVIPQTNIPQWILLVFEYKLISCMNDTLMLHAVRWLTTVPPCLARNPTATTLLKNVV